MKDGRKKHERNYKAKSERENNSIKEKKEKGRKK